MKIHLFTPCPVTGARSYQYSNVELEDGGAWVTLDDGKQLFFPAHNLRAIEFSAGEKPARKKSTPKNSTKG